MKNLFKRKNKDSKAKLIMMLVTIATVSAITTNINDYELESNLYNEETADFRFLSDDEEWIDLSPDSKREKEESTKLDLDNYISINKECNTNELKVTTLRTTTKNKFKKLEIKCVPQTRR